MEINLEKWKSLHGKQVDFYHVDSKQTFKDVLVVLDTRPDLPCSFAVYFLSKKENIKDTISFSVLDGARKQTEDFFRTGWAWRTAQADLYAYAENFDLEATYWWSPSNRKLVSKLQILDLQSNEPNIIINHGGYY